MKTAKEYFMKECGITKLDDIYTLHYSELFQWMEQYALQQTAKLNKDLKNAEAKFEKMELTAFNLEKKVTKLEGLIEAYKNLLDCFGIKKPEKSTHIDSLDNAFEHIEQLEKQIKKL